MKINFSTLTERLADIFGEREALVNVESGRRYSFREYHLLTNRIVNMMHEKLGIQRGDRYMTILNNDDLSLFSFPTMFKGLGCACMTNFRDSLDEHTWQIDTAEVKVIFIAAELLDSHYEMLHQRGLKIVALDPLPAAHENKNDILYFWDLLEGVSDANPNIEHDDREDVLLMRFTGGTTGKGKCAMYSIDNWLMCRDSFYTIPGAVWNSGTRFLHLAPISHGSGMMILPTYFQGGCTVTMNTPDLGKWCQVVEAERITGGFLVPTLLYRLLELEEAKSNDLSSLQELYYGAAPMSPAKLKSLQEKFGNIFVQVYGATEHICVSITLPKSAHLIKNSEDEKRLAAAGVPLPGVEVLIADDDGNPVPRGEIGEIWLRSRASCSGYFNNPEKTAEEFSNGYWKSADMAYMDDAGFTYIVDRKKDMIISGGFNIYATEVESAINAHPAILMSAVVGVPHEEWGEAVYAEVVLRDEQTVEPETLRAFVREQLGGYKTPKQITVVDELPLSVVGKVLRRKVREKYWQAGDRQVG